MVKTSLLHALSEEESRLEILLDIPPLDYMAHRLLYTTLDGERALATILRDASGNMEVRRVVPGKVETSSGLRNWLEVDVFLDLGYTASNWMRDTEEEERRRAVDRLKIPRHD
jgi:hypothetical protein